MIVYLNETFGTRVKVGFSKTSHFSSPLPVGAGLACAHAQTGGQQEWRCSEELRVSSCDSAAAF